MLAGVDCDVFVLIAAMNPCPCGYSGDPVRECRCTSSAVARYQKRISRSLLDRIDIHLEVSCSEYDQLSDRRSGELSVTTGRVTGTPFPGIKLGAGQRGATLLA